MSAASAATPAKIPKPNLRNLVRNQAKVNLGIMAVITLTFVAVHRVFVCEARKSRYAEFNKTYDPEAAFERMRKKGVFQSCPP